VPLPTLDNLAANVSALSVAERVPSRPWAAVNGSRRETAGDTMPRTSV